MATPNKITNLSDSPQKTKRMVLQALRKNKEVKAAADALGVSEQSLHRYMKNRIKRECTCRWIDIEETVITTHASKE
jgi:hypothetical protein